MTSSDTLSVTVRFAVPGDMPALGRLFEAMYEDWGVSAPADVNDMTAILENAIMAKDGQFEALIAKFGDESIGFAAFGSVFEPAFMGTGGFLRDVFVVPQHRRKGAGANLMHFLLAEAGKRQWVSLDWHVNRLDFDARTFFEIIAPDSYTVDRLVHRIEGETLTKQASLSGQLIA